MKIRGCRRNVGLILLAAFVATGVAGCAVFNVAPVAELSSTMTWRFAPSEVVFDGSASHDPDGIIVKHEWDFGDGTSDSGESVTHTYAESGQFSVTLTVTDNHAKTGTATQIVTVHPPYVPPGQPPNTESPDDAPVASFEDPIRFEATSEWLTPSFPSVLLMFIESAGSGPFRVVLLDAWSRRVAELANTDGPFEERVEHFGGSCQTPYSLYVIGSGPWAITVYTSGEVDELPQTYAACSESSLSQYSPWFYLQPGQAAFHFERDDVSLVECYGDHREVPLSHDMHVSGGLYVLKIHGGGCWEIGVEQRQ